MDAISFVLGIKSSQLRSAHLKDLVYRGRVLKTSKINDDGSVDTTDQADGGRSGNEKTSRGDPKTAWVMAVYEDDAGEEQRWKRSITNQGASEYRINERIVTAQQYNEALERENILMKARNFLVFQGDVEAIASQSPQDLTRLVEQISGSLEFKSEYEKLQVLAEQAAENQNFQLHRRRGINSEIKQYREQKKEADNFQKKTEEREAAIVTQTLWKLYHFQKAMDESKNVIQHHQEELKDMRRNVATYEERLDVSKRDQQAAARQVSRIERDIKGKEKSIEEKENSIIPYDEKINQTKKRVEYTQSQIDRISRERDDQASVVAKVAKDIETVSKAEQEYEKDIKDQMKKQGREISDDDRKEYNALRSKVMSQSASDQAELDHLERDRKSNEVTVNNLKGKVESVAAAIEKSQTELTTINEKRQTAQSTADKLGDNIDLKKKEIKRLQSDRADATRKRVEKQETVDKYGIQLKEADDGRRQSDKEKKTQEMVKSLQRHFGAGVHGRVGDLCIPKQKKFEDAILVALGRNFDSVVVDTEKVGSECIAYLRQNKFATMSFIPLDNIKVPAINTAIKSFSGARLAIDTVTFPAPVERAISYACGNSVVCDTDEIAEDICYHKKIPVEAVTLKGFVFNESGSMTGGRGPEKQSGKRTFDADRIPKLQHLIATLTDEIAYYFKAERPGADEISLQSDLDDLERQRNTVNEELQALNKNHASKKRELDSQKKELKELRPKYEQKASQLNELAQQVRKYRDAIAHVEDNVFASFCARLGYSDIRAYEASQGQFEQEVSEQRSSFSLQRQRLENRHIWEVNRHSGTEARIKKVKDSIRTLNRDIKAYEQDKKQIEEDLRQEQAELEALRETLDESRGELAERSQKVTEAKAELQKRSKGIDNLLKNINQLESVVQKNNSSKSALLRRCRLEQIQIPLTEGNLDNLPAEDDLLRQEADAMDIDGDDDEDMMDIELDDHGIDIDFSGLDDDLKEVSPLGFLPVQLH